MADAASFLASSYIVAHGRSDFHCNFHILRCVGASAGNREGRGAVGPSPFMKEIATTSVRTGLAMTAFFQTPICRTAELTR